MDSCGFDQSQVQQRWQTAHEWRGYQECQFLHQRVQLEEAGENAPSLSCVVERIRISRGASQFGIHRPSGRTTATDVVPSGECHQSGAGARCSYGGIVPDGLGRRLPVAHVYSFVLVQLRERLVQDMAGTAND